MPEREREGKVGPANQEAIQNNKYSYASRVVKFNSKRFMWLEIQEHASGGRHINPQQHATATNLFDHEKCIYNYCKDCRYRVSEKTGADACPFNYLYWDFVARNETLLLRNPRTSQVARAWSKLDADRQLAVRESAARFLLQLEPDTAPGNAEG